MSLWKDIRAQEKAMMDDMDDRRRRANRRAKKRIAEAGDPLQNLFIVGVSSTITRDSHYYNLSETKTNL